MTLRLIDQLAPEPCVEVAEWAEDLARRARLGEIQSIAFCVSMIDGQWFTGSRGASLNGRELIGELEALKFDTLRSMERRS